MSFSSTFTSRWRHSLRPFNISLHMRNYAVQAPGRPAFEVFNGAVKHMQKDRAARKVEQSRQVDYIKDEVAKRLCERLLVRSPVYASQSNCQWLNTYTHHNMFDSGIGYKKNISECS